jgi:hypothetical protein
MKGSEVGTEVWDPLQFAVDLPLTGVYYPLGFRLEIATNSPDILQAAEESWAGFTQRFPAPPIRVRVAVSDSRSRERAGDVFIRAQGHLAAMISNQDNFAICDFPARFAFCWLTSATAADHAWIRYYYIDTIANLILWHSHLTRIHAGCVALNGDGVLLCGRSGAGKSCLTYACARSGWTLVSDEAPAILREAKDRVVLGKPQQIHLRESALDLFPELKGRTVTRNAVGKMTLELSSAELGFATQFQCRVNAIVFLNRRAGSRAHLVPLSKEDAWDRLEGDLPYFEQPVHEEHKASITNLLRAATYELDYEDLDAAVAALERMVQQDTP